MTCGERFASSEAVAEHVLERHSDTINENTCPQCGKQCKDKKSLQKHSWVHSEGDEGFPCTLCEKKFHSRARLRRYLNFSLIDFYGPSAVNFNFKKREEKRREKCC